MRFSTLALAASTAGFALANPEPQGFGGLLNSIFGLPAATTKAVTTTKTTTQTTTTTSKTTTTTSKTTTTTTTPKTTSTTTTTTPKTSSTTSSTTTTSASLSSSVPTCSASLTVTVTSTTNACPATPTVTVWVTSSSSTTSSTASSSPVIPVSLAVAAQSNSTVAASQSSSSVSSSQSSSASVSTTASSSQSLSASVSTTASSSPSSSPASSAVSNTVKASASSASSVPSASASVAAGSVGSTILIIAPDDATASQAYIGLNGYGIPYQKLIVPQAGIALPTLNNTNGGLFGGIVVINSVTYDYGGSIGYASALTNDQWTQLYNYQTTYNVRMAQWGVWPSSDYGVSAVGGCCNNNVEQFVWFSDTSAFSQAGLVTGAKMSTQSVYHTPATITDSSTTKEIAQFGSSSDGSFPSNTYTAAVINNFAGREQMVYFLSVDLTWSTTNTIMQHAWITWMTRGLYAGFRRVHLNTQIDDMMLLTNIYYPSSNGNYRVSVNDVNTIASWVPSVQSKMNPGSKYLVEVGFNGDGNINSACNYTYSTAAGCNGGAIYYTGTPAATPEEWKKPLGTGTNYWPSTASSYPYTAACASADPLGVWWSNPSNRANFLTISHTFTHLSLNNATYSDTSKEITWNQQWFNMAGMNDAGFSPNGLIPPAITGLHNGDALQAWWDAGITNAVGDNSRPVLRNTQNTMWAYHTNVASDGFAGMQVIPRWSTRIYYDCDTPICSTNQWAAIEGTGGSFSDLLEDEVSDTMQNLFGLDQAGYMFHQLNLRSANMTANTTPDGTQVASLFQTWVEYIVQGFVQYANWPLITEMQSTMSTRFANREARDGCGYSLSWTKSKTQITGVTVSANGNSCSAPIPVTVPGGVTDTQGFQTEQIGNDPLTIWVQLTGQPVSFTLNPPISL